MIQLDDEFFVHAIEAGDFLERAPFAFLCSLPVAGMQQSNIAGALPLPGDGGADTRIHAATQQHDGLAAIRHPVTCNRISFRPPSWPGPIRFCATANPGAPPSRPRASTPRA